MVVVAALGLWDLQGFWVEPDPNSQVLVVFVVPLFSPRFLHFLRRKRKMIFSALQLVVPLLPLLEVYWLHLRYPTVVAVLVLLIAFVLHPTAGDYTSAVV